MPRLVEAWLFKLLIGSAHKWEVTQWRRPSNEEAGPEVVEEEKVDEEEEEDEQEEEEEEVSREFSVLLCFQLHLHQRFCEG